MSDQLERDLWTFSLTVYGREGVQEECLALQEQFGVDVNLLLFCAYLGAAHCVILPRADILDASDAVSSWHADIVVRLRQIRRTLKPWEAHKGSRTAAEAQQLRSKIKAAELESERIEQGMLAQWAMSRLNHWPCGRADDAVSSNVASLLGTCGAHDQHSLPARLINAALATASNAA